MQLTWFISSKTTSKNLFLLVKMANAISGILEQRTKSKKSHSTRTRLVVIVLGFSMVTYRLQLAMLTQLTNSLLWPREMTSVTR